MDEYKIIDPFKPQNVEIIELPEKDDSRFGTDIFGDVKEIQIGKGSKVFRANQSGIWLGAETFEDAPFSVSMTGEIIATGLTLGSLSGNLDDIDDGTTYKRAVQNQLTGADRAYSGLDSNNEIIKGFLSSQLSSKSLPTNGVRVDNNGIYGRKAGSTTFYISSGGDAYFSGDIVSSTMTAGTISGATITGGVVQTASSGIRVVMGPSSIYSAINGSTVDGISFKNGGSYYGGIYPWYSASKTGIIIGDEADCYINISPDDGIDLVGFQVLVNGSPIGTGSGSPWTDGVFTNTLRVPVGTNMY